MATYLKRSSKLFETLASNSVSSASVNSGSAASSSSSSSSSSSEPSLRDLICPVCRALLREPVTLPCAHNLCLGCLRASLDQLNNKKSSSGSANLISCPLCGQRLGSWLRSKRKHESLVNLELWKLICKRFPEESEQAACAAGPLLIGAAGAGITTARGYDAHCNPENLSKKLIITSGNLRKEYEAQLQVAEEEMRRQREKERLANEALLRKIQEEEKQQKLLQLAQDQLLAKTLAKNEVMGQTNDKYDCPKNMTMVNSNKTKLDVYQSKSANQKLSNKSKGAIDSKKQNIILASKIQSERFLSSVKSSSTNVQKDSTEIYRTQKSVPIHNAVTRVVTHQNRLNQSNNSTYLATRELVSTSSKIYGLQTKEELHVPNDVISNKKKKLGVEVCVTNIEGEERIGSAESAGSHDSINQEIHHFKPIKPLPRTPLKLASDGRQIDPKLIRVLPALKRVSNAVPKPPTPVYPKKGIGCSWSAFKKVLKQQHLLLKDLHPNSQLGTKKTDKKLEQIRNISKSNKDQLSDNNSEVSFDTNKNYYTKNVSKPINGTRANKKLNLDNHAFSSSSSSSSSSVKPPSKRAPKIKNGQLLSKQNLPTKEQIEVVHIDDDDDDEEETIKAHSCSPSPVETPKDEVRPIISPMLEIVENIAERIKRRNTSRIVSNTANNQSAINQVVEKLHKAASKKSNSAARNQKAKKPTSPVKPKVRTKIEKVTTLTSQIKRLAARSSKKPRYTEDSESEEEHLERCRLEEQLKREAEEVAELERSVNNITSPLVTVKKSRKTAKSKKLKQNKKSSSTNENVNIKSNDIGKPRSSKKPVNEEPESQEEKLISNDKKTTAADNSNSKTNDFGRARSYKKPVYTENSESEEEFIKNKINTIVSEENLNTEINVVSRARSSKKPVYTEDSESDEEKPKPKKKRPTTLSNNLNIKTNEPKRARSSKKPVYTENSESEAELPIIDKKKTTTPVDDINVKANYSGRVRSSKKPVYAEDSESEEDTPKPKKKKVTSELDNLIIRTNELGRSRSLKKPRYEDSESEEEYFARRRLEEQEKREAEEAAELERSIKNMKSPSLSNKKPLKSVKSKKPKQNKKVPSAVDTSCVKNNDLEIPIDEVVKNTKSKRPLSQVQDNFKFDPATHSSPPKKCRNAFSETKEGENSESEAFSTSISTSSSKKSRPIAAKSKSKPKQNKKKANTAKNSKKTETDEEETIKEKERLEQERKDLELALQLQEQFNAMARVTVRTRRGISTRSPNTVLNVN